MNNKINIGIIGFGKMGKIRYDCLKNINSVAIQYIAEENSDINIPPNLKVKNVDVIFHLAALNGIPYSYKAVKSYIDTNITGTYNVLNAAKKNNVSRKEKY